MGNNSSLLILIVLGGAGAYYWWQQREDRDDEIVYLKAHKGSFEDIPLPEYSDAYLQKLTSAPGVVDSNYDEKRNVLTLDYGNGKEGEVQFKQHAPLYEEGQVYDDYVRSVLGNMGAAGDLRYFDQLTRNTIPYYDFLDALHDSIGISKPKIEIFGSFGDIPGKNTVEQPCQIQ